MNWALIVLVVARSFAIDESNEKCCDDEWPCHSEVSGSHYRRRAPAGHSRPGQKAPTSQPMVLVLCSSEKFLGGQAVSQVLLIASFFRNIYLETASRRSLEKDGTRDHSRLLIREI